MKFYASRPSRERLAEDVRAFASLLKYRRDEQAEKLVLSSLGKPAAEALLAAVGAAGLLRRNDDASLEGPWRDRLEDPLDPYGLEEAKQVEFERPAGKEPYGDALYRFFWDRAPAPILARLRIVPKAPGFTLALVALEAQTPAATRDGAAAAKDAAGKPAPAKSGAAKAGAAPARASRKPRA